MIRFTLALVARSGRWVAPAVVYLVWLVLVLANPGPALTNGANMFFGVVVFAVWFAVVTGNVDDDPHRDLCAAVAGSPARLHARRAIAGIGVTVVVAVVTALATGATGDLGHRGLVSTTGWSVALLVAGALIGSTIGVFLHRPLIDGVAWSVVLAAAASLAVVLLPPVQTVLRHLDHGSTRGVGILLVVAAVVAALAVVASSAVADRRS
jgi:hypothetical protein